jgi:class 3 adenylate cyclase/tetratricopeptide (TPR) repeat protein
VRDVDHHPYLSALAVQTLATDPPGGWVDVDGTLAFFDISGFTPLTERLATVGRAGAEHINDVLNTVFTGLIDVVFRFGGDVLEFGGDAMVVLYSGPEHEGRAAMAAAEVNRFMARLGRVETPAGKVQLGVSCGMASGTQAYYLLGRTRRALVVAGPVSTAMARLEAQASSGEVQVSPRLAAALPQAWSVPVDAEGARLVLPLPKRTSVALPEQAARDGVDTRGVDTAQLLPVQFRGLADVGRRTGELKQVAMAFIRLTGTDDLLAREGVAGVHDTLARISDIVDVTAAELDVCWLETQAEANSVRWTLISGAPTATERDSERLLRVLRRIADASPLPLRIGCNLGVVFVGDMGHPDRCTYIVMGDATNLAARLMGKAEPGQIIAGERLIAACAGRFETVALEPFPVKGKRLPVQAFLVDAPVETTAVADIGPCAATEPAMVGRDAELATLITAIDGGGLIEIVGEAGVGKTRLWHEARRIRSERAWHVVRAEPHETGAAYLPIRRLLRDVAGVAPHADATASGRPLDAFVRRVAPDLVRWLPLIADVVGAEAAPSEDVEALDPAYRVERMRSVVADLIAAVAKPTCVIVIEDGHWLDESSRALVDVLARTCPPNLSLVLTRRASTWMPPARVSIDLQPIADSPSDDILLRELPASVASDATLTRLKQAAAGNPLYLLELARAVASGSQATEAFPETLERVMAARIDELPAGGRGLIREASVLGAAFDRELAARVLDRPELIDARTWAGALADLVVIDGDGVRFCHDLVRVAAYEGLSVRRRKELHGRAGEMIEAWGEQAPVTDPIAALAFHATGSGVASRIVECNQRAAEAAMAKGAMELAERLLGDVIAAQRETRAARGERLAALRRLASAAEGAGHPDASLDASRRAARLATGSERSELAVDRVRILTFLGRYRAGLGATAQALRTCSEPTVRGHLLLARARIRNYLGQWKECLSVVDGLLADHSASADPRVRAQAHVLAEWCCSALALPQRSEHADRAEQLLVELDDSLGLGNLYLNRGESAWRESRARESIADFEASSERYQRAGYVLGSALADNNIAEVRTLQMRLDEAERLLHRARRVTQAANYPLGTSITISGLSRIAAWRGDVERAHTLQSEALTGFTQLGADDLAADSLVRLVEIAVVSENWPRALEAAAVAETALGALGEVPVLPAMLCRLRGRAFEALGRTDEARLAYMRAIELSRADQFPYEVALASIGLGRLDCDQARIDGAMAELAALDVLAPPPGT